jgi:glutathione synthase/RimK-type ligase-like ATP-grasp enzyme
MRLGLFTHGPSNSLTLLANSLRRSGANVTRLLSGGNSRFRARTDDVVLNYGSSAREALILVSNGREIINHPDAVSRASNKVSAFQLFNTSSIPTVAWTIDDGEAQRWMQEGHDVFARTETNGHSGEGIVLCSTHLPEHIGRVTYSASLSPAPLYTVRIGGNFREYRVHVAFGEIILTQQKRRRNGWSENENYSRVVRNHDNGWIYATSNTELSEEIQSVSRNTINALGLDYGAVDLIVKDGDPMVLEVNTAPGMTANSTLEAYTGAFLRHLNPGATYINDLAPARELYMPQDAITEPYGIGANEATPIPEDFLQTPEHLQEHSHQTEDSFGTREPVVPTGPWTVSTNPTNPGIVWSGGGAQDAPEIPGWSDGAPNDPELAPLFQEQTNSIRVDQASPPDEGSVRILTREQMALREQMELREQREQREEEISNIQQPLDAEDVESANALSLDEILRRTSAHTRNMRRVREEDGVSERPLQVPQTAEETTPLERSVSTERVNGVGHYVVEISPHRRTIAYVNNLDTYYSAELDMILNPSDIVIISQVEV